MFVKVFHIGDHGDHFTRMSSNSSVNNASNLLLYFLRHFSSFSILFFHFFFLLLYFSLDSSIIFEYLYITSNIYIKKKSYTLTFEFVNASLFYTRPTFPFLSLFSFFYPEPYIYI
ncbi:hypothetical protein BDA99DRAFT_504363 [Phascolomyces articulosus]|uniref:Uncharacterized protein n=1 Tax=Phascolomyces articulosus TaxID=60185 RepID=A0AAD5PFN9_9FUNG|nr:hypothetical protein BDA99DRAFT_504363 [Phascolomyces articulosus]